MKARDVCAAAGIAIACGAVVFTRSLVETNDAQAVRVAESMMAQMPVADGVPSLTLQLDYRPGGRVMQGPPLSATIAVKEGVKGVAVAKSVFAARKLAAPAAGDTLVFLGRRGSWPLEVSEVLPWDRPAGRRSGYPDAFVSPETAALISEEWRPFRKPRAEDLAAAFKSDAGRNFDKSRALLLWAAALTSVCLLVNTLVLSVEARRRDIALARVLGLQRKSVVARLFAHSAVLGAAGCAIGSAVAYAALRAYVAFSADLFPAGPAFSARAVSAAFVCAPLLSSLAALFALRPALAVKPLEAASARLPRRRTLGMFATFAFGFGSFVAVEVWGSSLMSSFVPSKEWPDAIVSILPSGVSAFDIDKLRNLEGVEWISELQPLQVDIHPLEELKGPSRGGKQHRNALLLASSRLPAFRFTEGDAESAQKELASGFSCVITSMMARARRLKKGDSLVLDLGRGETCPLKIAGVVDLNWHMVTSRGLLRGLGRMPVNTDGPAFVSFDTLAALDMRPQHSVPMTHLWLDYRRDFLETHGPFEAGRIVERRISEALGGAFRKDGGEVLGNTVRLHSRDEVADGTLAHGNDIVGSMAKVPFIFIAVASLGFIAMLVASADARRREFAVMRAVGAARTSLAAILASDALKTALWGMAAGLAGGTAVGWLSTFSTTKVMSNWGLAHTLSVPWRAIGAGAAASVAIVLAIAVPAALAIVSAREKR